MERVPRTYINMTQAQIDQRRKTCKINQRRYRQRKQQKEDELVREVENLKVSIHSAENYNEVLRQSSIVAANNRAALFGQVMESYARLFSRGTNTDQVAQRSFLTRHFEPHFKLQSENYPAGAQYLHQQWARYSSLFPHIFCKKTVIEPLSLSGDVVRVRMNVELPITRPALAALYPNILADEELTQKLLTKVIRYELFQTVYFSDNNKAEYMHSTYDIVSAWSRVLDSVKLTAELIKQGKLTDGLIQVDEQEISDVVAGEAEPSRFRTPMLTNYAQNETRKHEPEHVEVFYSEPTELEMHPPEQPGPMNLNLLPV